MYVIPSGFSVCEGVFARRGHSANYYIVYPGNTPENHPPTEAGMIHSKQHGGQTRGYGWWKTADFPHSARCAPCPAHHKTYKSSE